MSKVKEWLIRKLKKAPHEFQDGYLNIKAIDVLPLIDQLDEPDRVIIPRFVANYLETAKKEISLLRVFEIANGFNELDMWREEYNWIRLYHLDFARAWLDGYEIEKEKLYYVKLPTAVWNDEASELEDSSFYLRVNITSDEIAFSNLSRKLGDWSGALTEKQIKNIDPRYWPFAEPVEESP